MSNALFNSKIHKFREISSRINQGDGFLHIFRVWVPCRIQKQEKSYCENRKKPVSWVYLTRYVLCTIPYRLGSIECNFFRSRNLCILYLSVSIKYHVHQKKCILILILISLRLIKVRRATQGEYNNFVLCNDVIERKKKREGRK